MQSLCQTKSASSNLYFAGAISTILRVLLLAGKFLFIIALTKWTTPSTVGIYALIMAITTISIYLIGLELHSYTTREVVASDTVDNQARHMQSHLQIVILLFIFSLPAVATSLFWLGISDNLSFILFFIVSLGEVLCQELARYLIVLSKPIAANFLQLVRGAAWMPFAILTFTEFPDTATIDIILAYWAGGCGIAAFFGFWKIGRFFKGLHWLNLAWFITAFSSARHYFIVALLTQVQNYADRFIIQYYLGESMVGLLAFYQSFANSLMGFVQTGVVAILLPNLLMATQKGDAVTALAIRRRMFRAAIAITVLGSMVLIFSLPLLINWLDREEYGSVFSLLYWLLLGNLFLVAALVPHFNLYARREDVLLMRIMASIVPLSVVANLIIIPRFGLSGAVVVFALSAAAQMFAKYYFSNNLSKRKP